MGGLQAFQCDINEWINNGESQINDDCYGWKSDENIFLKSYFEINVRMENIHFSTHTTYTIIVSLGL